LQREEESLKAVSLKGRVAVVTGASKGLGKQIAESLAAAGAAVAVVARNSDLLKGVAEGIQARGGKAEWFSADVSDENTVAGVAEQVIKKLGGCDILVNNAGINIRKAVEDFTLAEWNHVIGVNLTGAFLTCRAFVPGMKKKKFGRILNTTSIMSHVSMAHRTVYSASKAGLLGMTKALAIELASYNITVNGISPGPFATEMNKQLLEDPRKNREFMARIPLGRWGRPEEVGSLAVYLCSDAAGFITGTDIVIDGGWIAQ
jgi:NAD(P)-dependent dehydrogenase (short-subunit alcohol dehydrogenase family)